MKLKAQTGIEFMAFVAILLILLLVIASNSSFFTVDMMNTRTYSEGKKMADSIAFEINTAAQAGNGYQRRFYIDNNIFGRTNFVIAVSNYSVTVDWAASFASTPIVVGSIQGNLTVGWHTINNTGGIIYVS